MSVHYVYTPLINNHTSYIVCNVYLTFNFSPLRVTAHIIDYFTYTRCSAKLTSFSISYNIKLCTSPLKYYVYISVHDMNWIYQCTYILLCEIFGVLFIVSGIFS